MHYGLDFGTTNSSLSLQEVGEVHLEPIDPKAPDPKVLRSMLYFFHRDLVTNKRTGKSHYEGQFKNLIGEEAIRQFLQDNTNRGPGIVRQIFTGKMLQLSISPDAGKADLVAEYYEEVDFGTGRLLQALKSALRSKSYKGTNVFGKYFTLEQLISFFISNIPRDPNIKSIKVGRPVKFSEDKGVDSFAEKRLQDSLKMAGFENIIFEYEPVAAAKYFLHKNATKGQKVFVFDFGGGTLDTAIVEKGESYKVLVADGVYIGGNLLNSDIFKAKLEPYFGSNLQFGDRQIKLPSHIFEGLSSWFGIGNLNNPSDMRLLGEARYKCSDPESLTRLLHLIRTNLGFQLYESIEWAKKELTLKENSKIVMHDGPINIETEITKNEFETIIAPRTEVVKRTVQRTLKDANLDPSEIDFVVRTGGSSLIPVVEDMLVEIFGPNKVKLFDTFTSIAAGLALE